MSGARRIEYIADFDGSIDDLLCAQGVSSTVRVRLRKELGLICKVCGGKETPVKIIDSVKRGEKLCIYLKDFDVKPIPKWDYPINIIYQDEDIAVIDKSAGVAVIPTKKHYGRSLANALASVWGDFVYRPVNRLDRDTSGLMIVAKNQLAHSVLASEHIYREYVGLCSGEFVGQASGMIDKPIKRDGAGMNRIIAADGDRAVTRYQVIKQYDGFFACRFVLETGRTHQIRLHMSSMGYPLCCDKLYNPDPRPIVCPNGVELDRQALHSCKLSFVHPIDGRALEFTSSSQFLSSIDTVKEIK